MAIDDYQRIDMLIVLREHRHTIELDHLIFLHGKIYHNVVIGDLHGNVQTKIVSHFYFRKSLSIDMEGEIVDLVVARRLLGISIILLIMRSGLRVIISTNVGLAVVSGVELKAMILFLLRPVGILCQYRTGIIPM